MGLLNTWAFEQNLGDWYLESLGVAEKWFFRRGISGISEDWRGERRYGELNALAKVSVFEGSLDVLFDLISGEVPIVWKLLKFWTG